MVNKSVYLEKGEAGVNGGPAGDLYVVVHVRDHEFFEREGDHIICEMPLTFAQMALGAEVEVPTVHGKVKLKIPAGTQTGTEFRLKGKRCSERTWIRSRRSICSRACCCTDEINFTSKRFIT